LRVAFFFALLAALRRAGTVFERCLCSGIFSHFLPRFFVALVSFSCLIFTQYRPRLCKAANSVKPIRTTLGTMQQQQIRQRLRTLE
jgi:hypothetical protein